MDYNENCPQTLSFGWLAYWVDRHRLKSQFNHLPAIEFKLFNLWTPLFDSDKVEM